MAIATTTARYADDVWDSLRVYGRYVGISMRGQMQYRASALMLTFSHLLITGGEFLAIWALFHRFGSLRGWTLPEVALLYGMIGVAFALSDGLARGFDVFAGSYIKNGSFDRILLRPRSTLLQIAGHELRLSRAGRLIQALVVLLWATARLHVAWTVSKVALLFAAEISGVCVFCGLFILQATLCFWTIEALEIINTLTYGGTETAEYPMDIYRPWFRSFFTFIVPLACVNYFPSLAILGRRDPLGTPDLLHWLSPVVGVVFLAVCVQVWHIGVRHYRSTGS